MIIDALILLATRYQWWISWFFDSYSNHPDVLLPAAFLLQLSIKGLSFHGSYSFGIIAQQVDAIMSP